MSNIEKGIIDKLFNPNDRSASGDRLTDGVPEKYIKDFIGNGTSKTKFEEIYYIRTKERALWTKVEVKRKILKILYDAWIHLNLVESKLDVDKNFIEDKAYIGIPVDLIQEDDTLNQVKAFFQDKIESYDNAEEIEIFKIPKFIPLSAIKNLINTRISYNKILYHLENTLMNHDINVSKSKILTDIERRAVPLVELNNIPSEFSPSPYSRKTGMKGVKLTKYGVELCKRLFSEGSPYKLLFNLADRFEEKLKTIRKDKKSLKDQKILLESELDHLEYSIEEFQKHVLDYLQEDIANNIIQDLSGEYRTLAFEERINQIAEKDIKYRETCQIILTNIKLIRAAYSLKKEGILLMSQIKNLGKKVHNINNVYKKRQGDLLDAPNPILLEELDKSKASLDERIKIMQEIEKKIKNLKSDIRSYRDKTSKVSKDLEYIWRK